MNKEEYLDEYKLELMSMSNEHLLFELGSIANIIGRFEKNERTRQKRRNDFRKK